MIADHAIIPQKDVAAAGLNSAVKASGFKSSAVTALLMLTLPILPLPYAVMLPLH